MQLLHKIVILFLFLSILSGPYCWATTYYVDATNGSDFNMGISENAAWKTIRKAANIMTAGDTTYVKQGVYNERVHIEKSGSPNNSILYQATGTVVTHGFTIKADFISVNGFEITDTINEWADGAGIHIEGKHCQVTNNYIHDVTRVGIQIFAYPKDSYSTSYCVIRDNRIEFAGLAGIEIYGRNNVIENNDISHILQYTPKWTNPPDWADADGIHFCGAGHIIRKNYIHHILLSDKGNIDPHIDHIQTFGPAYDIVFEQNFFEHTPVINNNYYQGAMVEQIVEPVKNLTFRNNIFKNHIKLNFWGQSKNLYNVTIVNNTFIDPAGYAVELHDCPNAKVVNNIFYYNSGNVRQYLWHDTSDGLEVDNNCYYVRDVHLAKRTEFLPRPSDLWQVDPKFVDVTCNNFKLRANSPLIDSGKILTEVFDDFNGIKRPEGSGWDIGAFEYKKILPPTNLDLSAIP